MIDVSHEFCRRQRNSLGCWECVSGHVSQMAEVLCCSLRFRIDSCINKTPGIDQSHCPAFVCANIMFTVMLSAKDAWTIGILHKFCLVESFNSEFQVFFFCSDYKYGTFTIPILQQIQ